MRHSRAPAGGRAPRPRRTSANGSRIAEASPKRSRASSTGGIPAALVIVNALPQTPITSTSETIARLRRDMRLDQFPSKHDRHTSGATKEQERKYPAFLWSSILRHFAFHFSALAPL